MLTGKTIGELTLLETLTPDTLFPVELSGDTYHAAYSSFTSNGGGVIEVTYSELVDNITGGTLTIGAYYIISDFKTCYDQPDYDYNKNAITTGIYRDDTDIQPIVVFATSSNTISDVAYQPAYPKDRIRYDWTFSTTERTSGVAYGRISERIDEFNNRTDYDHRQIKFKRYRYYEYQLNNPYNGTIQVSVVSGLTMSVSGTGTNFNSIGVGNLVGFDDSAYKIYEIIDIVSDTEMTVTGLTTTTVSSGRQMYQTDWDEYSSYYQNNVQGGSQFEEYYTFDFNDTNINNYIGDFANLRNWEEWDFLLANNVFHNRFNNNKFGDACFNNTFFDDCWNNDVGNYFYNNITDDDFDNNEIGSFFRDNRITSNFQDNRIGQNFRDNYLVQNSFYRNNIMNDFRNNEISGDDFQNNEIGNQFNNNILRNGQFYKNDIGNGFNQNKIYWGANGNLIGNGYNNNNIYCQFYDNIIGEYFYDNTIGDILNPSDVEFYGNIIVVNFNNNTITNDFYKNQIGTNFSNNDISGQTNNNVIGNTFQNNTIYGDFYDNQIFNEFKGNMTYQDFNTNKVDWGVASNEFSGSCGGNSFGPFTTSNDFLGNVFGNVIKGDFNGNTIGDGFGTNNIGAAFFNNTIAQNFANNEIGNFFTYNTIGEGFGFGGSSTQKNYIGDEFYNNTVGEYFYNNRVGNYFQNNTLGDYFQWNVINTDITQTNFTLNYGNITGFSYTATGTSASNNLYLDVQICGTTESMGVDATFDIQVSGGTVTGVSGNTEGRLYKVNDTLTILGTQIGGVTGEISGFSSENLSVKIYKPADPTYEFPSNETEMDYLIDNSPLFDTYYSPNIQGVSYSTKTGIGQNQYGMVIDGYIQIPSGNTYYFGLSSDDGSDAFINGVKVADWYGAHGDNGNFPGGNQYPISLTAGTYPIKVRLQERSGQDIVILLYSLNSGSTWNIIPNSWFTFNTTGTTGSYPNIVAQGGNGQNATFDVDVIDGLVASVVINQGGGSYKVGDILTISGSDFGSTEDITIIVDSLYSDDIVITVTGVTSGSLFYEHYTKQIFEIKGGNKRVSFYDEEDILNVDSIYTASGYIPVYSQSITFPLNNTSFTFECNGSYTNNGGFTGNQTNSTQDVVNLFNGSFRSTGYFFDNNNGTIGVYINPSLKQQYCPSGTYTINVFND